MSHPPTFSRRALLAAGVAATAGAAAEEGGHRPNIVFILADDLASHAVSAYGSRLVKTPHIDRLAREGMLFENAFCTNAICTPSRASFLTGTYSHVNGVTTLHSNFDARQATFPRLLQRNGYQTALIGKWHLGHGGVSDPHGFDHWEVLRGQGRYRNPKLQSRRGVSLHRGYVSDVITRRALVWLKKRDRRRPFCLLVHHKAPHSPFTPPGSRPLFPNIPQPATLRDNYAGRAEAAKAATMRIARHLGPKQLKKPVPEGLTSDEELSWKYQRFMEDYLRCVKSLDRNVGRLLRELDRLGLTDNTMVVFTSDQGFFLGDHGWFDKRFIYEQSLRVPLIVRHPRSIRGGTTSDEMVLNIDLAQTLLDAAGVRAPSRMQGRSVLPLLRGQRVRGWRTSMYYRYWMHDDSASHVRAHYGVRTQRYKLIYYYSKPLGQPGANPTVYPSEWELFDLDRDPEELTSVHDDPAYSDVRAMLEQELSRLQNHYGDQPVLACPGAPTSELSRSL